MPSSRRDFLRRTAAASGAALVAPSLAGLVARIEAQDVPRERVAGPGAGGYGALRDAGPELALPAGFTYWVISEINKPMSNGQPTPCAFDGMAAFPLPNGNIRLIRNHENRDLATVARVKGAPALAYDRKAGGGTTSLEVRITDDGRPEVVRDFVSLSGTYINCAGGPTPWGSWLTCEETVAGAPEGFEQPHGYVFEVPAGSDSEVRAVPIKAMGRFEHEAIAIDPDTGIVYLTEDRQTAGFYRFTPRESGELLRGGRLEMLRVVGRPRYDTATAQVPGQVLQVDWVRIDDPDATPINKDDTLRVFTEGQSKGGARFARLEGCWPGDDGIFFHATSGGNAAVGQVWFYRPRGRDRGELTLVYESPAKEILNYPDNVTMSPRGGIVMCEDGSGTKHIRGLTRDGKVFEFARNIMNTSEFCGACFAPDGETLFLNVQGATTDAGTTRGVTVAVRGPWRDGAL
jgi:secreted PhoX family phosphatase